MPAIAFGRSARLGAILGGCLLPAGTVVAGAPAAGGVIESYVARATAGNPRQTEADVLVRRDGSLLAAWSDFHGGSRDESPARISAAISRDGGRTWGERYTLQENSGRANVMSATLRRSRTGDVLFFYLRKNSRQDLKVHVRRSTDDAVTWGEPVPVTPEDGYHVMNNARVLLLKSGRLLAPVATTKQVGTRHDDFRTAVYLSDDDGHTWRRSRSQLSAPRRGAMEPGLVELRDGRVMQIIRTQTGFIWRSFSRDGGDTWDEAEPWNIESPEAPATLAVLPDRGDWLLVWNPVVVWGNPERTVLGANHGGPRTPLAAMVSGDEGRTWSRPRLLESDPKSTYAYASITCDRDRVLLTYYDFPEGGSLLSLKFRSVPLAWFRDGR